VSALLIDTSNLLCRAFFAPPTEPVHDLVTRRVERLIRRFQPQHVMAALDAPENFRKGLYAPYKQQRAPKDPALRALLEDAPDLMRRAGCIPVMAALHEADDVIATLAARAPGAVVIASTDADLYSCLSEQVTFVSLADQTLLSAADFRQTYGFEPSRFALYKALCGDTSDNYPGVRGIGPKSARLLTQQHSSVQDLYRHAHRLPDKVQALLLASPQAETELYWQLATLNALAPVKRR